MSGIPDRRQSRNDARPSTGQEPTQPRFMPLCTDVLQRERLGRGTASADYEDDEIVVAMRPAKRARLEHAGAHSIRIGATYLVDGTMTPVSSEAEAASPTSAIGSKRRSRNTKRGRSLLSNSEDTFESDSSSLTAPAVVQPEKSYREVSDQDAARLQSKAVNVDPATNLAYPRFMYQGWEPPADPRPEHRAVSNLQNAFRHRYPDVNQRPEYTYFMLDDFSIYLPPTNKYHAEELVTLEKLTLDRKGEFYFAGILSFENKRYFVQDVPFSILTLEYGISQAWKDRVCIQSTIARNQNVYYKLGRPAKEYERFYTPFLLIAQFGDYFITYLCEHEHVTIADFRDDFWDWLQLHDGDDPSPAFEVWHSKVKLRDFRTLVAVQVEFLWKECWDIDLQSANTEEPTALCKHPIWSETHPARLQAIPAQPVDYCGKTVVTPYAYACFQAMYFGDKLDVHNIIGDILEDRVRALKRSLELTPLCNEVLAPQASDGGIQPLLSVDDVCVGDVVVVPADKTGSWKQSTSDLWFAYVQRIWTSRNRQRRLDVIWLYQPEDTTIGNAFYPWRNELFLSDNCGCGTKEALHLDNVDDVVGKVNVSWFTKDPAAERNLFVRRIFRTVPELNQYDFVKLEPRHFRCCHQEGYIDHSEIEYRIGDSVLVRKKQDADGRNCKPSIIVGFTGENRVRLRKLINACEASPGTGTVSRPNELIFTNEVFERREEDIIRPCHIRFFGREQIARGQLPTPYDRDGTGDYFYIVRPQGFTEADTTGLNEAWDPQQHDADHRLTGLGLFSGGGTFERGLEEGGAVKFRYAVDIADKALHSYRANDHDPEQTKYYLGSVNEYLASGLAGKEHELVAEPGSVHVIAAGSPCQGFSRLQQDKNSDRSKQNASMVASVISYVDLYAPRYLVLENVVAMTATIKEHGGQNVFSQMIAALVGLGYQVQQFLMDSNYQGSASTRSRVFILASAPTCEVLEQPEYTHARPADLERTLHLGRCSNGKPFGSRRDAAYVPFAQVSAADSVRDLPVVSDGQPLLCPQFPDHRPAKEESAMVRNRIAAVPKRPFGMSLKQAALAGLVSGEPLEYTQGVNKIKCGPNSKAYRRVFPDRPFPTMITTLAVEDGMNGQVVHWNEDRVLTIMEARRAQGYPDHEVLVGTPRERLKIVGNSVDRSVALVLGLALRESWLKSPPVGESVVGDSAADISASVLVEFDASRSEKSSAEMPNHDMVSSTSVDDTVDGPSEPVVDNRTVKMALNLSTEDIAEIRTGGFKRIKDLLSRPEHLSARRSLQDESDGKLA